MNAGRVTPGPIKWTATGKPDGWTVATDEGYAMLSGLPKEFAEIIAACLTATSALNPTDPLAAAQHLEALVKAADLRHNSLWAKDKAFNGEWVVIPMEDFDSLRTALSAVTGRP